MLRAVSAPLLLFALAIFLFFNFADGMSLFYTAGYQLARRDIQTPYLNATLYVGCYLLSLAGLVVLYGHAWRWLRYLAYLVTVVTVTLFLSFKSVNQYGFAYHEASLIWAEPDHVGAAVSVFAPTWIPPLLVSLAFVATLEWYSRFRGLRLHSPLWLALPIAALFVNHELLERTHTKVHEVPIPYRVPQLTYYAYAHRTLYYGERDAPYLAPVRPPLTDHIVFVVDESVSGDQLGINGGRLDTTPFLSSIAKQVFNYGVASAASNLSSSTNIILQSGLRVDQLPDRELRSLKNPNVFSYLQEAGFAAFFLDAQAYSFKPPNFMTTFDLRRLDGHLQLRRLETGSPEYEIDFRALDYLEKIVGSHDRSFTYLVKAGAHFPYDAKYPPDARVFAPTLSSGGGGEVRERTLNSYANALRWSVDAFLGELTRRFTGGASDVVVIYTSDHGQSLDDAVDDQGPLRPERPVRWPHAIPVDPPSAQAAVPLLLLAFGPTAEARIRALYDESLVDRVSHFELFATLLYLAGYDAAAVRERYAHSIFDASAPRIVRFFVSGNLFGIGEGFYQNKLVRSSGYLNAFSFER